MFHTLTASALTLSLGLTATAPPRARVLIDLVFDSPMRPLLEASAMNEVAAIWSAYAVDVRTLGPDDAARDGAIRLDVVLAYDADRRRAEGALGSIRFLDEVPEPVIVMYPNTIAALVQSGPLNGRSFNDWPSAYRDLMLGRVFGRALAHEIGHFLLRSSVHADVGLMRPRHPVPLLVAPDRQRFVLTPDEARFVRGEWSTTSGDRANQRVMR